MVCRFVDMNFYSKNKNSSYLNYIVVNDGDNDAKKVSKISIITTHSKFADGQR